MAKGCIIARFWLDAQALEAVLGANVSPENAVEE
jgi:hypothetical protein